MNFLVEVSFSKKPAKSVQPEPHPMLTILSPSISAPPQVVLLAQECLKRESLQTCCSQGRPLAAPLMFPSELLPDPLLLGCPSPHAHADWEFSPRLSLRDNLTAMLPTPIGTFLNTVCLTIFCKWKWIFPTPSNLLPHRIPRSSSRQRYPSGSTRTKIPQSWSDSPLLPTSNPSADTTPYLGQKSWESPSMQRFQHPHLFHQETLWLSLQINSACGCAPHCCIRTIWAKLPGANMQS